MTESANTGSGQLDEHDAVNAILKPENISDALSKTEVTEAEAVTTAEAATRTDNQAPNHPEEEIAAVEELEEVEESEEEVEAESEEEDAEEPEETEEEEEKELSGETVLFTTSEGEEVTLDEARRSYLRQADYTKKTQKLAEVHRQVQQTGQQLSQQQSVLAENLTMALDVLEPQLAGYAKTDWNALAADDAYEYAEKRALFDQAQARYNQIVQASQQVVQQQKAQTGAARQQRLAQEGKALQMALPEMADPKKGRALRNSLREYALSNGLSESEAGGITDHRIVLMMNKARLFDEMNQSGIQAAKKKIAKSPKRVIKAGQPQTKSQKQTQARKDKASRLRQTGSIDDAVDLLMG